MNWLRPLLPNRISGQIAILIAISLIVFHIVLTAWFFLYHHDHAPEHSPERLATLIELIDAAAPDARAALLREIGKAFPRFELALAAGGVDNGAQPDRGKDVDGFAHRLGPRYRLRSLENGSQASAGGGRLVAVVLPDGQSLTARLAAPPPPRFLNPIVITLLSISISATLLCLWAARELTRPLGHLAKAAENFTPSGELAPLPEQGPHELRVAARALNQMRERIKKMIEERTHMLAAVSHDLRTPITRLRLRCEFIDDPGTRARMLDDLAHMNAMLENVLHFLRDGQRRQQVTMIDLATSLQTICDQFADVGHHVSYDGPDHVIIQAYADELHRAFTNLIDNAVRHGGMANVRVNLASSTVTVAIEDDGSGIADGIKKEMFEPFVRGDAARGMNSNNGFGLGLSIARAVIESHSGTLTLVNRAPRGVVAMVILPRTDAATTTGNAAAASR